MERVKNDDDDDAVRCDRDHDNQVQQLEEAGSVMGARAGRADKQRWNNWLRKHLHTNPPAGWGQAVVVVVAAAAAAAPGGYGDHARKLGDPLLTVELSRSATDVKQLVDRPELAR